jgi:hypothetical protein
MLRPFGYCAYTEWRHYQKKHWYTIMKIMMVVYEIWGSHGGKNIDHGLLCCRWLPAFRRNQKLEICYFYTFVTTYKTASGGGGGWKFWQLSTYIVLYLPWCTSHNATHVQQGYAIKIARNVIQRATSNASMQSSSMLAVEVWLTSWLEGHAVPPPPKPTLYRVFSNCACANRRLQ